MHRISEKKKQLQKIENGKGIQHILDEGAKMLGNPILVQDMNYMLVANTDNPVADDPIWNEFLENGTLDSKRIEFYREENFFEVVANAKKTTLLHSGKLKYDRLFGKLFAKDGIQVGAACLLGCLKEFEDGDLELFEEVCGILDREFSMSEFFQEYGQAYLDFQIGCLIDGSLGDIKLNTAHLEAIYSGLKDFLYVAVLSTVCEERNAELSSLREEIKKQLPEHKYAIYNKYLLVIAGFDDRTEHLEETNALLNFIKQQNLYAGISGAFENIVKLPEFYRQALGALTEGLKSSKGRRIFFYDSADKPEPQ